MKRSLLLHFPCRDAVFDWFGDDSSDPPRVTIDLLAQQRDYEWLPGNGDRRVTCQACGDPRARYVGCRQRGNGRDLLYLRRYPGSARWHKPGCFSYSADLVTQDEGAQPIGGPQPGGDFAALWRDVGDPEYRVVAMRRRKPGHNAAVGASSRLHFNRVNVSLRRLARDVLQRSGVCSWRPEYKYARDERVFNGLVKGALNDIAGAGEAAYAVLSSLPGVNFIPWSFLHERDRKAPAGMTACVGFGFIESFGPENERGARLMHLSNYPDRPILVPRVVLDHEGKKPASPLHSLHAHPTWVIFVASLFGETWKVHAMVPIRVSTVGLIPVESFFEDRMVRRLIGEKRSFTRWLLPPPELAGSKYIPDLQLTDTVAKEFVEVCGLMHDPAYAANIARKKKLLGDRLLIWDTRRPLNRFRYPPSEVVQYQAPKRLPFDPMRPTPPKTQAVLE